MEEASIICGYGGIGRRAGFRFLYHWCVGSSPTTRTIEALTWILIGKLPPASNARQCQAAKICGLVDNACLNIRKQSNQSWICGYVGIGRQASLRCLWPKGRVSSNLTSRTKRVWLTLSQNKLVSTAYLTEVADCGCEFRNLPLSMDLDSLLLALLLK